MPNQTEPNANNALGDGFAPKVSLIRDFWCKAMSGIFRERYGECMDIGKLLASGLLVWVMTLGGGLSMAVACCDTNGNSPADSRDTNDIPLQRRTSLPGPQQRSIRQYLRQLYVPPPRHVGRRLHARTDSTPTYIWIPKYADPFMADKMINSYPATVVTLCTGIFGGAWSPNDANYWETFDICAVNAQLGFPDPTGVATKGCVSKTSGCKKYQLKRLQ